MRKNPLQINESRTFEDNAYLVIYFVGADHLSGRDFEFRMNFSVKTGKK